jgi:hypothetical protein
MGGRGAPAQNIIVELKSPSRDVNCEFSLIRYK